VKTEDAAKALCTEAEPTCIDTAKKDKTDCEKAA
jgi:hypothetical protein